MIKMRVKIVAAKTTLTALILIKIALGMKQEILASVKIILLMEPMKKQTLRALESHLTIIRLLKPKL